MSGKTTTLAENSQDALEAAQLAGISEWIAENFGGDVQDVERVERWRPQWIVTYTANNETNTVFVRGDRPISGEHALRFEMEVIQALEKNGIKVPHVHGWMDSPKAFVMDCVDTEDRAPGMLHTAIDNPTTMSDERWAAMLNYMDDLAKVHAIPVDEFTHIRGMAVSDTPDEIALRSTERMYKAGLAAGNIDPVLEFLQQWLRRNVPEYRTEISFVTGDAGQFMSAGSEVVALLDFEIAHLGDTHWDLACFRGRHPYENMGDIPALYRRYGESSGNEVDLPVVAYHTVNFLQLSAIAARFFMNPKAQGSNWIEGVLEYASTSRRALEAIAELKGIKLDYDLRLPEPVVNPFEDSGLKKLMVDIERIPTSTAFEPWEQELLGAIPKFLINYSRYKNWLESEAVADVSQLTGESFDDLSAADARVLELIASNDADHDEALVQMMHRRTLRLSMIVAGTDPDDGNPLFHKLDPILK